jgi:hypothetical protein
MAISDTEKLDLLWKKNFGTSKTAGSGTKLASNETVASPTTVYASSIWANTDSTSIPETPPVSTTANVGVYTGANRYRCTNDPTAPSNLTWFTTSTFGTTASRTGDFVPSAFGAGYAVKVYIGDPNGGPAARILPDTTNEEWIFDYVAGVLTFPNTIPASRTATIGTATTVSVASNGIYIEGYRYVGSKGFSGITSGTTVVANIAARDALTPFTGQVVHVIDASGNPTDAAAGEWAEYLWTGAWVLTATQDSARSDSLTTKVEIDAASTGTISIGNVGNGARVVEVSVEVTDGFDGDMAISVGDASDNLRLMGDDQNDLQSEGAYVTTPIYQYPAGSETAISIYVTGTATLGNATIIITYA